MGGKLDVIVDSFKLLSERMLKNIGVENRRGQENIVALEHCHIYHTYDSNGRKQMTCNSVGGHYHNVEVMVGKDGGLTAICSPPIQGKASHKELQPNDTHTHKVQYLKSETVELRKASSEAAQIYSNFLKEPYVAGVVERQR
jgi:hypothetical protein